MKPRVVFERLEVVIGLDGVPRRLRNAIEEELAGHFGLAPIVAAELAERLEASVATLITDKQIQSEVAGTLTGLVILGSSGDSVAGSCHVQPTDSPAIAQAKAHRLHASPMLARIQQLTFPEFEKFGAKVLRELGAQSVRVTPQSNDQGIDFFGVLNLGAFQAAPAPFFRLAHDIQVRFAGQAKHYPNNPIGTATIRELVGAVSLARFKTFSKEIDPFDELLLAPLSPLVTILFTTGRMTSGAVELASKAGVLARSGEQLALFLADRGVGMDNAIFDAARFDLWLNA